MEKSLCLFIFLCSALLEVHSLECYVCDNCPTVKLNQIQTCGPTLIPEPSISIATTTKSTTTEAIKPKTSSASTTVIPTTILTTTSSEAIPTTTSATNMVEEKTIFMVTTAATSTFSITPEITTTSTTPTSPSTKESTTSTEASSTTVMQPTNTSMLIPAEPLTSSKDPTITTSSFPSTTTEAQFIKAPTGSLTTESMTTMVQYIPTVTASEPVSSEIMTESSGSDTTVSSTVPTSTSVTNNISTVTVSEPGSEPITEPSGTYTTVSSALSTATTLIVENLLATTVSDPKISSGSITGPSGIDLPTVTAVPDETFSARVPAIQSFSLPSLSEQNKSLTIQKKPSIQSSSVGPTTTFTTESPRTIATIYATNDTESLGNIKPAKQTNLANNLRKIRSSPEGCACKNDQQCDCSAHERSRRYTLRGLGLSKEGVKYVCFVDKYQINGTELVKRGCATKEEDDMTSCKNIGSGANCKICDSNQCNSAAIIQSSILLMSSLYLLLQ